MRLGSDPWRVMSFDCGMAGTESCGLLGDGEFLGMSDGFGSLMFFRL